MNIVEISEIVEIVKFKLSKFGITWQDNHIELMLKEVDQAIKNYCHIEDIPPELKFVRAGLTVDCIRYQESNVPSTTGDVQLDTSATSKIGPLTYLISGAVTYGFGNNKTNKLDISNAHVADLDAIVSGYEKQLNAFRRVVW